MFGISIMQLNEHGCLLNPLWPCQNSISIHILFETCLCVCLCVCGGVRKGNMKGWNGKDDEKGRER